MKGSVWELALLSAVCGVDTDSIASSVGVLYVHFDKLDIMVRLSTNRDKTIRGQDRLYCIVNCQVV